MVSDCSVKAFKIDKLNELYFIQTGVWLKLPIIQHLENAVLRCISTNLKDPHS